MIVWLLSLLSAPGIADSHSIQCSVSGLSNQIDSLNGSCASPVWNTTDTTGLVDGTAVLPFNMVADDQDLGPDCLNPFSASASGGGSPTRERSFREFREPDRELLCVSYEYWGRSLTSTRPQFDFGVCRTHDFWIIAPVEELEMLIESAFRESSTFNPYKVALEVTGWYIGDLTGVDGRSGIIRKTAGNESFRDEWRAKRRSPLRLIRLVRAGHAWMSADEWNTLMHIIHGNTTTTTTTTTSEVDGPVTTKTPTTPPESDPTVKKSPKAKAKTGVKTAAKGQPKAAAKTGSKPKSTPAAKLPGATFVLSGIFGSAAWGFYDSPPMAAAVLIGAWLTQNVGTDLTSLELTIADHQTKVVDILGALGTDYKNDLDPHRIAWLSDVGTELQTRLNVMKQTAGLTGGAPAPSPKPPAPTPTPAPSKPTPVPDPATDPAPAPVTGSGTGLFPTVNVEGSSDGYSYKAPDPKDVNHRSPSAPPVKLNDSAGLEQYRTWKLQILAWMSSCSESRYPESAVRTQLIASIGDKTQSVITNFFNEKLGQTSVQELLKYLDQRFHLITQTEDRRAVKEFREFHRTGDMSLQQFLVNYRSLLERAMATGYQPASDLSDELIKLSQIGAVDHGGLVGKIHELERNAGPMNGTDRHKFVWDHLWKLATSVEKMKFDRGDTSKKHVNAGVGKTIKKDGPKRPRNRKPKKKKANAADAQPKPQPKKQTQTTVKKEQSEGAPPGNADLAAAIAQMSEQMRRRDQSDRDKQWNQWDANFGGWSAGGG